jgi:class 3 adenylate cyclase
MLQAGGVRYLVKRQSRDEIISAVHAAEEAPPRGAHEGGAGAADFSFRRVGARRLKGFAEPVTLYALPACGRRGRCRLGALGLQWREHE